MSEDRGRYRIVFEGKDCIGSGRCAEVSDNWSMNLSTGIAEPENAFVDDDELDHNVEAAEVCPAKNGRGVIHVLDTETGEVIAPEDGDWEPDGA